MEQQQESLPEAIDRLSLSVRCEFVPFSQSRNAKAEAKPSERSLNWRVTLIKGGRDILTTDYSAGIGYCPSYQQSMRWNLENSALIAFETETGFPAVLPPNPFNPFKQVSRKPKSAAIEPKAADVIYSLAMDSDVLDYSTFEEWADSFGYDPDSRKAESVYRACLEIALKLRNGLGEFDLAALRAAALDY